MWKYFNMYALDWKIGRSEDWEIYVLNISNTFHIEKFCGRKHGPRCIKPREKRKGEGKKGEDRGKRKRNKQEIKSEWKERRGQSEKSRARQQEEGSNNCNNHK